MLHATKAPPKDARRLVWGQAVDLHRVASLQDVPLDAVLVEGQPPTLQHRGGELSLSVM